MVIKVLLGRVKLSLPWNSMAVKGSWNYSG